MSRTLSGASFLLVCLAGGSLAAAPFSTLEERMSQSEFKAAGLERLSPEELKSLNDWLRSHGLTADAPMAMRDGKPDFYPDQFKRETVETRIAGAFTGWLGKTRWTMENGQVWEQAESGRRQEWSLQQPTVRIKPMIMGSWLMSVEGCGCNVRVQRVK
ncbi:MAG TPA: hypothetical protein PLN91_07350 [Rhodanobacteraceae bacterium]|nr:hypothetical protein [Rhodanobacteraceae bacterium]